MDNVNDVLKSSIPENFQIKVTILECRQLNLGTEDTPNPYINIKVTLLLINIGRRSISSDFSSKRNPRCDFQRGF